MKHGKLHCIIFSISVLFIYLSITSYSTGISGQYAAGCTCHGNGVSNPNTIVTVAGPSSYIRNQAYTITVTVNNASRVAAGFNLKSNIGTISNVSTGAQIFSSTEIGHNTPRTITGGAASWTFTWTAPAAGSTALQFQIAGNAVTLLDGADEDDQWNFGVVAPIPLPIGISSFDVVAGTNDIDCIWNSNYNANIDYYEMQRSRDGLEFLSMSKHANTPTATRYQYTDKSVVKGEQYFYRIKEVLKGGGEYYTMVKTAMLKSTATDILLYPTVIENGKLFVDGIDFTVDDNYELRLVAFNGTVVTSLPIKSNAINLPVKLTTGMYHATLTSKSKGIIHQCILIKK